MASVLVMTSKLRYKPFLVTILAATTMITATAQAAPLQVGSAPVADSPLTSVGQVDGNDAAALASCTIGGKHLLFVSGDVTSYDTQTSSHPVAKLFVLQGQTSSHALLWAGPNIGPGDGWVQTIHCHPDASGGTGTVYVGGSFTSFMGANRQRTAAIRVTTSGGKLQYALSPWTYPSNSPVNHIAMGGQRLYIANGEGVVAVNPVNAKVLWHDTGNCGAQVVLYHNGSVYIGGFSTTMTASASGLTFGQYGLVKVDATKGTFSRTFRPVIQKNEKLCNDPTATGRQTYSGSIPISLAWDTCSNRLVVGMGGMVNRLGEANSSNGNWSWNRRMDGDVQTVNMVKCYVFAGHHRTGQNITTDRYDVGYGGFFSSANGTQTHWPAGPTFTGGGQNRDGRNNGIIGSVIDGRQLCLAGGFNEPRKNFACFAIKP